jgi:hypothetical protein
MVIEKAYAKLHGSYAAIESHGNGINVGGGGGDGGDDVLAATARALVDLTGGVALSRGAASSEDHAMRVAAARPGAVFAQFQHDWDAGYESHYVVFFLFVCLLVCFAFLLRFFCYLSINPVLYSEHVNTHGSMLYAAAKSSESASAVIAAGGDVAEGVVVTVDGIAPNVVYGCGM